MGDSYREEKMDETTKPKEQKQPSELQSVVCYGEDGCGGMRWIVVGVSYAVVWIRCERCGSLVPLKENLPPQQKKPNNNQKTRRPNFV